jgi:hypothetical protein
MEKMNRRNFLTKAFQCGATVPLLGKIDGLYPTRHPEPDALKTGFLDYDLDAINAIKSIWFEAKDRPDLCRLIEDHYTKYNPNYDWGWERISLVHLTYYEDEGLKHPITWGFQDSYENNHLLQIFLSDILKQEAPCSYRELLYITTCFSRLLMNDDLYCRDPFAPTNFTKDAILDEMLQESRGNILYRDQLETIFLIAGGFESADVRRFCTDFFLQKDDAVKKIGELQWADGRPLKGVLEERVITQYYDYGDKKKKTFFASSRFHSAALALYRGLKLHSKNKTVA